MSSETPPKNSTTQNTGTDDEKKEEEKTSSEIKASNQGENPEEKNKNDSPVYWLQFASLMVIFGEWTKEKIFQRSRI